MKNQNVDNLTAQGNEEINSQKGKVKSTFICLCLLFEEFHICLGDGCKLPTRNSEEPEKLSRKNIKSVTIKSTAVISRGLTALSANASAAINTNAITESISAITSALSSMGDMVSASIGPVMVILELQCSFLGYGMKKTGHMASPMDILRMIKRIKKG